MQLWSDLFYYRGQMFIDKYKCNITFESNMNSGSIYDAC